MGNYENAPIVNGDLVAIVATDAKEGSISLLAGFVQTHEERYLEFALVLKLRFWIARENLDGVGAAMHGPPTHPLLPTAAQTLPQSAKRSF
jgi:hypothetical protein